MHFGTREEFDYFECENCGCLQINVIPEDLSKHYPDNYYSYSSSIPFFYRIKLQTIDSIITNHILGENALLRNILFKTFGSPLGLYCQNTELKLKKDSNILDVGSGSGHFLHILRYMGFTALTGIDPYIKDGIINGNGVRIFKKNLIEVKGQYDFILLNHSFEHMENPLEVLYSLYQILKPSHSLLIRIPIFPSFAWEKYKTNWVAIDAPRHLYLHSVKSMEYMAQKTGFTITNILYESIAFQFWASEQYVRDIPLVDPKSFYIRKRLSKDTIFSKREMKEFSTKAQQLNKEKRGDYAGFILQRP
ncbi:MAG: class I SAM-dependent methyltransferase [Planctomycetes bacterium]|nr:class I SAM-dependent methyltransferase [Planctomycetota bacterium]